MHTSHCVLATSSVAALHLLTYLPRQTAVPHNPTTADMPAPPPAVTEAAHTYTPSLLSHTWDHSPTNQPNLVMAQSAPHAERNFITT